VWSAQRILTELIKKWQRISGKVPPYIARVFYEFVIFISKLTNVQSRGYSWKLGYSYSNLGRKISLFA
jgi:hypothetical protein